VKRNMGALDRTIRILVAVAILFLYLFDKISGVTAVILGVVALVFLLTSLMGVCPMYGPLKFSTRKDKK